MKQLVVIDGRFKALCRMGDGRPVKARDLCNMHYSRWLKHGDPNIVYESPVPKAYQLKKGDPPPLTTTSGLRGYLPAAPIKPFLKQLAHAEQLGVLSRQTGFSVGWLCRLYKTSEWVRWDNADIVCCALKMHPASLWPNEWTSAA